MAQAEPNTRPACLGVSSAVMFPEVTDGVRRSVQAERDAYRPALALCARCDHHEACRAEWEDIGRPDNGVWFGMTPPERKALRPRRPQLGPEMLRWLRANSPATAQEIYAGLGEISGGVNAVYSVLRRLRLAGQVVVHSDTSPVTYSIVTAEAQS